MHTSSHQIKSKKINQNCRPQMTIKPQPSISNAKKNLESFLKTSFFSSKLTIWLHLRELCFHLQEISTRNNSYYCFSFLLDSRLCPTLAENSPGCDSTFTWHWISLSPYYTPLSFVPSSLLHMYFNNKNQVCEMEGENLGLQSTMNSFRNCEPLAVHFILLHTQSTFFYHFSKR